MKNHAYSMINGIPLLLKNLCQNQVARSFVHLNHFNELVTNTETCFLLFNIEQNNTRNKVFKGNRTIRKT